MKFFKDWSYNRKLQNHLHYQSSRDQVEVNTGNQIGVVFDYENENDLKFLQKFKEQYKSEGKFVQILAYIEDNQVVNHFDFKAFTNKELSWEGIPNSPIVTEFLERKYDIIFFPIRNYSRPLEFVSMVSQSRLKVGTFRHSLQDYYDILLDIKPQTRINDIFDQFLKHLNILVN